MPDCSTYEGFQAIADERARVLILGTLPSPVSLQQQQYYAQPRNCFWKILGQIAGFEHAIAYVDRTAALKHRGIALWDVCFSAVRPGALDASIVDASVRPNKLAEFAGTHPDLALICFNGRKAEALFWKHFGRTEFTKVRFAALPSTSPAHAAQTFEQKLALWREAIHPWLIPR
jgi:double-stranded uracil-DNA glycosylase